MNASGGGAEGYGEDPGWRRSLVGLIVLVPGISLVLAQHRAGQAGAMALSAAGSMGVITAYQMGLIKHLPEPPFAVLDADKVDASGEA